MKQPIIAYWYMALASSHGIELAVHDADSVKSMLYQARKEAQDLTLGAISVVTSPFDPMKLWLRKKDVPNAPP